MFPGLFGIGFSITSQKSYSIGKRKIHEFIVNETLIKVGNELVWLWIAIELDKTILGIRISYERSICLLQNNLCGR